MQRCSEQGDSTAGRFICSGYPVRTIRESTTNPRRVFDETKLREFADNIRLHGVLQAILVRPVPDGEGSAYELVAGARRFRASS